MEPKDTNPALSKAKLNLVQQIVGTFLYYALALDNTMLVALGDIVAEKAGATDGTYKQVVWFLKYAATHPDAVLWYSWSKIILRVHSDASYLSVSRKSSRARGNHFLSDNMENPMTNGAIHTVSRIMANVMGSAAEAEIGSGCINAQDAVPERISLIKLGHLQPPTSIQVDNTTCDSFTNGTLKQKRSKAIDMRFYWLQDRCAKGQFRIYWIPGSTNLGDYHTKHHPLSHHRLMRPLCLHTDMLISQLEINLLRGCGKSHLGPPARANIGLTCRR